MQSLATSVAHTRFATSWKLCLPSLERGVVLTGAAPGTMGASSGVPTQGIPIPTVAGGEPYILGLTGSIGMGKSTIGEVFADLRLRVLEADHIVHRLYASGGRGVPIVAQLFPEAVVDGAVDRRILSDRVLGDANKSNLEQLEQAIHPLVEAERLAFVHQAGEAGERLVVLDIPLLFERDMEKAVDAIVVVTTDSATQRARVMARPGMSQAKFEAILAKQVPDHVKRQRAHFVIDTTKDLNLTRIEIAELVHQILASLPPRSLDAA